MILDAVVLAGGRSARLDGTPKVGLRVGGRTLLELTLDAAAPARAVVVVGEPAVIAAAAPGRDLTVTRETPAYAGPVAALAAGCALLAAREVTPADAVLVLAADMPGVCAAVAELLAGLDPTALGDGAVAVSPDGRVQHLVGIYATAALTTAFRRLGDPSDRSLAALLAGLRPSYVTLPPGLTDDVDTWADASRLGATPPPPVDPVG